jgi:hypothetical protein
MRSTVRRTSLAVVTAAVALGCAAGPALAAPAGGTTPGGDQAGGGSVGLDQVLRMLPDTSPVTGIPAGQLVRPVTHLKLDPLAQTGTDPLDNSAGAVIGDLPVGTQWLTGSLAHGASAATLLPLGGQPAR